MNKYQKVINQIAKDDLKASFRKVSFKVVRQEIRAFAKELNYNLKELIEHKNYCKGINQLIFTHKKQIIESNRLLDSLERR
ncbi:hypothetical protein CPAST_c40620 [Clostridium pasteurianum DSM 525 = ATCC 6013]|uniref:Uncharacterized protein n=1 Tax=Clostridium pasteurianum DSM 525 = ATCC 6013 TaxID=1262449 RepID=A0A0H3J859_CLOPA|nr:hypothetical protein [Clostridium pasteurianum]AJA50091.1 hypothetical protein CPAST_c40620 [Clostridium pasteurianum DSM 525 = ATCC 6013]AJA54079.1 hypothetical protein CLPA_c40620 [Clostridium pasteurianum DSM 525 = ATCC 6013]AOZ77208.1 hypothetical protein AQ983_19730 [Clostridium pasteurianum DSM 525 = ATCC 6013]AOZ81004.1 hypothetical protein AQ984_19725 [Clostridium pasteurianum]ELP59209.1 hypothetical protein F502_10013 [Clostridium pasteurianum DSM 525 = ATCC 6013]